MCQEDCAQQWQTYTTPESSGGVPPIAVRFSGHISRIFKECKKSTFCTTVPPVFDPQISIHDGVSV